ncbi:hypothetical protein H0B56_17255 [Haloechinothrix sp. YIM 98757]|uniref:Uncharacterized protein n=1 Tax=Haloechinothrix aidingensis TaxID=2752311 RepID=A0A838ADJ5_9PSEU|nr:hypothetical protein [Haloechinothrix aidingensis]MBA0127300.1 hypothetical protein [Haloechinothrix aidingensis]
MCADDPHVDHDEANDGADQQPNTVVPFTHDADRAGVTVHIDHVETTPMTDEQYRLAVTALAALINQWKHAQQHNPDETDNAA